MTFTVKCPNGHRCNANDNHAGQSLPCPACGATVVVPALQDGPLPETPPLEKAGAPSSLGSSENVPIAPTAAVWSETHPPAPRQTANGLDLFLLLGGAAGGSVLAALLILVIAFAWNRSDKTPAPLKGEPQTAQEAQTAREPQPTRAATLPANDQAGFAPPVSQSAPAKNVREAPKPLGITEKLRQIGLAFGRFHDSHHVFALPRFQDLDGLEPHRRPPPTGLSWRVHLLPYVDQKPLYDHFHLDEPWDSPHNKGLLSKMPEVYRTAASDESKTHIQVITGPNMLFGNSSPPRIRDLSDGVRHTILAIVTGADRAVAWTKPDELILDLNDPLASLGPMPDQLVRCVMADGKPLIFHDNIDPASFLALATPHGNEIIDAETFRRQFEESRIASPEQHSSGSSETPPPPAKQPAYLGDRMKKLKNIVLAMQGYHDNYGQFPISKSAGHYDQDGQPFLSWRVHLLASLGYQPLYGQFKLDEPWNSPHNMKLIDKMPAVFRDPQDKSGGSKTRYVTLTGPDTPFCKPQGPRTRDFRDGLSTTLLVVVCGADVAVPWTKPEDIAFTPEAPLECLGTLAQPAIYYARADGAVKVIRSSIPAELFQAIVTPAGGEKLPREFAAFEIR